MTLFLLGMISGAFTLWLYQIIKAMLDQHFDNNENEEDEE